jgi:hypothetical protein
MSIKADIRELSDLKNEIKILQAKLKNLRKQAVVVQDRITLYLKSKETPGVKYEGNVILLEQKEKAKNKPNKQKEIDAIRILENYGIKDSQKVLTEILQARKGDMELKTKLKIEKIKV